MREKIKQNLLNNVLQIYVPFYPVCVTICIGVGYGNSTNRGTTVHAMIIPGAKKVLFGALPMEAMDLMVNPVTQEVVGVHGDKEEFFALLLQFLV